MKKVKGVYLLGGEGYDFNYLGGCVGVSTLYATKKILDLTLFVFELSMFN